MCFPYMCEALSQEVMGVIVSGLARRRCVVDWRERERELTPFIREKKSDMIQTRLLFLSFFLFCKQVKSSQVVYFRNPSRGT